MELDLKDMAKRIRAGGVIPIVGPELLRVEGPGGSMRLDQWLGERLVRDCTKLDPRQVAEAAQRSRGHSSTSGAAPSLADAAPVVSLTRTSLVESFRAIARAAHALPLPSALQELASIRGFRLLLTTTIDGFLAKAVRAARKPDPVVVIHDWALGGDIPDPYEKLGKPVVYQLCGGFYEADDGEIEESRKYVLTDADLVDRLYELSATLPSFQYLFRALREKDLLFLGCGYADWLQRLFIRTVSGCPLSKERERREWIVDSEAVPGGALTVFLQRCGAITWDASDPATFVSHLAEACRREDQRGRPGTSPGGPAAMPSPPSEGPKGGGHLTAREVALQKRVDALPPSEDPVAIFISYAHEDWAAAVELYLQLRGHGLPVWLDRAKLRGGEGLDDQVHGRIKTCAAFIPLLSKAVQAASGDRRWFRKEWWWAHPLNLAASGENPFIRPLNIDSLSPQFARIDPEWMKGLKWVEWNPHSDPGEPLPKPFLAGLQEAYAKQSAKYRSSVEREKGKGAA